MNWILLLVIAYFFISLTALADKFLVTSRSLPPAAYAFIISTLGLATLLLIPFGFTIPELPLLGSSLIAGVAYTAAVFFLYSALRYAEASRVFATSGAIAAVLTFIFSYLLLNERLAVVQVFGFVLLIIGGLGISLYGKGSLNRRAIGYALLTALAFGVSYTATRHAYLHLPFVSGLIWLRLFAFFAALIFIIYPKTRTEVAALLAPSSSPIAGGNSKRALIGGQAASAVGFLILNYVISVISAAVVFAAQGLQYTFLLVFTTFLSIKFPKILRETITPSALAQKIIAVLFIAAGLALVSQLT